MIPTIVALIPARCGSRRIVGKNIRPLGNKPLLAWTIEAAKESGIFAAIYLASDSPAYGDIARQYGAEYLPRNASPANEADITWVREALESLPYGAFAILRPTSPFRSAATIRRAWSEFLGHQPADSLRAVEPVKQHPGKMWVIRGDRMLPLLPWQSVDAPWHSSATQTLPAVYMQTASLEIAWSRVVFGQGSIAGTNVIPFLTDGAEALDLNTLEDWERAEARVAGGTRWVPYRRLHRVCREGRS